MIGHEISIPYEALGGVWLTICTVVVQQVVMLASLGQGLGWLQQAAVRLAMRKVAPRTVVSHASEV
jgi:hypothetical protein